MKSSGVGGGWSVQMRSRGVWGEGVGTDGVVSFPVLQQGYCGLGQPCLSCTILGGRGFLILQQRDMRGCPISDPAAALYEGLPHF